MDHLVELGAKVVWLSSIFQSKSADGDEIINYKDIDDQVGTMDDFDALVATAKAKGLSSCSFTGTVPKL